MNIPMEWYGRRRATADEAHKRSTNHHAVRRSAGIWYGRPYTPTSRSAQARERSGSYWSITPSSVSSKSRASRPARSSTATISTRMEKSASSIVKTAGRTRATLAASPATTSPPGDTLRSNMTPDMFCRKTERRRTPAHSRLTLRQLFGTWSRSRKPSSRMMPPAFLPSPFPTFLGRSIRI